LRLSYEFADAGHTAMMPIFDDRTLYRVAALTLAVTTAIALWALGSIILETP
jgi:hypothetical protein